MIGEPQESGTQSTFANRSGLLRPNSVARSPCSAVSTLAQNTPARSILGHVDEVIDGQNSTSGGSSDRAAKAWQENPTGSPPSIAVMTVRPVAKCPSTSRNDSGFGSNVNRAPS